MAEFTCGQRHSDSDPALFWLMLFEQLIDMAKAPRDMTHVDINGPTGSRPLKSQCWWFIPSNCSAKTKAKMMVHGEYSLLIADIDYGNREPKTVANILMGQGITSFVIYDTVSSRPNERRLRVVILLAVPVCASVWADLQNSLTFTLNADDCMTRLQQVSYLPTLSQSNQACYEANVQHGQALDPFNSEFAKQAQVEAVRLAEYSDIKPPAITTNATKPIRQDTAEHINPYQLFDQVNDWASLLRCCGFKKAYGGRWIAPCSSSGVAGVTITYQHRANGAYLSSHSSDPLCYQYSPTGRQTHDKFDVWVVHCLGLDHNNSAHRSQAITEFANSYMLDSGITLQKHNQRVYMSKK